ncbi:MAG TPA: hypothetical protein VME40_18045, partial [Caulobacteraceae bacterium]|nr:hypothetical protein [Caulobacteraceae bacterium]
GGLLVIVFIGFLNHFRSMYYEPANAAAAPLPISRWCVAPMALALVPLVVFGFWWPEPLWRFFAAIRLGLAGSAP